MVSDRADHNESFAFDYATDCANTAIRRILGFADSIGD